MTTHNSVSALVPNGLIKKLFSQAPEIMNPADLCLSGITIEIFCRALLRAARITGGGQTDKALSRFSDEQLIETLQLHSEFASCVAAVETAFQKKLESCMIASIEARSIRDKAETEFKAVLDREKGARNARHGLNLLTKQMAKKPNEASVSQALSAQK